MQSVTVDSDGIYLSAAPDVDSINLAQVNAETEVPGFSDGGEYLAVISILGPADEEAALAPGGGNWTDLPLVNIGGGWEADQISNNGQWWNPPSGGSL